MTARTVHLASVYRVRELFRNLFAPKSPRRCSICGGRLLQEANTEAEARRSGVFLGDLCERSHPITSIPGIGKIASAYRADFSAEEFDLVIAQIAAAHALRIARELHESGRTSLWDLARTCDTSAKAMTMASDRLIEARGEDALDVLLERLAKLREGA